MRCWFTPHNLEIGEVIIRGIDEAIHIYDKLLIILSQASVTSRWVAFEVNPLHREIELGRTMLFPIRLDDRAAHPEWLGGATPLTAHRQLPRLEAPRLLPGGVHAAAADLKAKNQAGQEG